MPDKPRRIRISEMIATKPPRTARPPKIGVFFRWVLPLAFTIIGLTAITMGLRSVAHGIASRGWPTAPGRVVSADVVVSHSSDSTMYEGHVEYVYTINGVNHEGARVSFGDFSSSSSSHAERIVRRYPVGAAIEVRYSPADADLCVLEPGAGFWAWMLPAMGLVFAAFGIGTLVIIPRMFAPRNPPAPESPVLEEDV